MGKTIFDENFKEYRVEIDVKIQRNVISPVLGGWKRYVQIIIQDDPYNLIHNALREQYPELYELDDGSGELMDEAYKRRTEGK